MSAPVAPQGLLSSGEAESRVVGQAYPPPSTGRQERAVWGTVAEHLIHGCVLGRAGPEYCWLDADSEKFVHARFVVVLGILLCLL
ncbi:hypothetical protein M8818_005143 [Zalaria obscura]|uniref:Uncharacterized protein n=1 Tax=Zalaria obscura TaxID=2024903 RepID=A0ACC3SEA3_9PEZI